MVVQVAAHGPQVAADRDAHGLQMIRRSDARQQQQLRRAIGAAGDDDFPTRMCCPRALRGLVFDTCCFVVLDQDLRGVGFGADDQVGPAAGGFEVGLGGGPAAPVVGGGLVVAAAFLLRAVEIGVAGEAGFLAGVQHRIGQFEAAGLVGDGQRAAGRVVVIGAARLVLGFLEVGENRIPVPADAAALAPLVVVGVVAADIDHAVDRAGAAQGLAARKVELAVGELRLRGALEFPVHRGVDEGLGETDRDVDPGVGVLAAGFQQQDAMAAGFGQARGDDRPGGSGAGDDVVVGFGGVPHEVLLPCD